MLNLDKKITATVNISSSGVLIKIIMKELKILIFGAWN